MIADLAILYKRLLNPEVFWDRLILNRIGADYHYIMLMDGGYQQKRIDISKSLYDDLNSLDREWDFSLFDIQLLLRIRKLGNI